MNVHRLSRHLAAAAAVTAAHASASHAAVVHWGDANLVIPATYAGLYINVEARTTGSEKSLAGWDINPYGSGDLRWYEPIGGGILRLEDGVGPSSLALGTLVTAAGVYDEESICEFGDGLYNWHVLAPNYFGFSFEAADGLMHFGWGRMDIGEESTTRVLAELAFESTAGEAIAVGAVPAPSVFAVLAAAGVIRRRRR